MYRLPKFLRPNSKTKLIRLGKFNDGGYSIPEKSLKEAKILFSFGLDEDWSFEEDFKKKTEAQIICFDNSVNNKFWIKRFYCYGSISKCFGSYRRNNTKNWPTDPCFR